MLADHAAGDRPVCKILAAVLAADASVRGDVLRDGSLNAALQRVRWAAPAAHDARSVQVPDSCPLPACLPAVRQVGW